MGHLTRRSVLTGSAGLVAAGTLARPYIANAAAKTAEVWWAQGFVPEEDVAFKKVVADYEKASGNKIELSIMPFAPLRQKIVSAMTSGVVPDLFHEHPGRDHCAVRLGRQAGRCQRRRRDAKGGVHRDRAALRPLLQQRHKEAQLLRRAVCTSGAFPTISGGRWSRRPATRWRTSRRPGTPITISSRRCRRNCATRAMRNVYGLGFQVTTNGDDPNNLFNYFLIAYGGQDIVTKDGKLHLDDPKVREAAIKALTYPTTAYKEGFVPPSAINWNDADDNNAFHAKLIVMDLDGTISTEVAVLSQGQEGGLRRHRHDGPAAQQRRQAGAEPGRTNGCGLIPKGAKNVAVAKDFLKYFDPAEGQQRVAEDGARPQHSVPCRRSSRTTRGGSTQDPHRAAYVEQGLLGPTVPQYWVYNPAYAQVQNEHVLSAAWIDIMQDGMTPQAAAEKAFKRVEEIFAKYPIAAKRQGSVYRQGARVAGRRRAMTI